jgi:hypothetical protein
MHMYLCCTGNTVRNPRCWESTLNKTIHNSCSDSNSSHSVQPNNPLNSFWVFFSVYTMDNTKGQHPLVEVGKHIHEDTYVRNIFYWKELEAQRMILRMGDHPCHQWADS